MAPPHTLRRSPSRRPKSTRPNFALSSSTTSTSLSSFSTTKRDKRLVKHSAFLSRIQKSYHIGSKSGKRRRPRKKLVTDLQSLGDALPEAPPDRLQSGDGGSGRSLTRPKKSLKSRPGAMKKREKVVREERERFEKNLAGMLALGNATGQVGASTGARADHEAGMTDRWRALRAHLERERGAPAAENGQ